jgi:hypothetical protein
MWPPLPAMVYGLGSGAHSNPRLQALLESEGAVEHFVCELRLAHYPGPQTDD